jgi:YegS/Rv2252/BmrU family lipid kinase
VTERDLRHVVAVGGDGTVHEVVNGLVDAETGTAHRPDTVLGVVAGGSGCDFLRTFGLDRDPATIARHLATDTTQRIDLGRARYLDRDGQPRTRLFANIAECGWGADVTERANSLPRFLGQARYLAAILLETFRVQSSPTRVVVDHTEVTEPMSQVIVANGQFFGGNIRIAPRAMPDDGQFNVQCWAARPADVLRELPRVRVGEHLDRPDIRVWQSRHVEVEGIDRPLTIEADGEVLGTTPATFDVVPDVLALSI